MYWKLIMIQMLLLCEGIKCNYVEQHTAFEGDGGMTYETTFKWIENNSSQPNTTWFNMAVAWNPTLH